MYNKGLSPTMVFYSKKFFLKNLFFFYKKNCKNLTKSKFARHYFRNLC